MEPNFNGTSLSPEHIGQKASDNLAASMQAPATEYVDLDFTQDSEGDLAANTIGITVQAKTRGGKDLAQAVQLAVTVRDANMADGPNAEVAVSGGGTLDTAANQSGALVTTGADGGCVIEILDGTGALAGDLIVDIEVVGREGVRKLETLTFA